MKTIAMALSVALAALPAAALAQLPMSTEFTFQGQLKQSGVPLDGTADLLFRLYDAETGGNLVDSAGFAFVGVENGLFTVRLDFGASVFDGENRWLEVEVEFPSGEGNWTTLTPRQRITATPYALQTRGLYVNDDGEVGIGTTNPTSALHVQDDASRVLRVRNSSSSGGTAIVAEATAGSGYAAALDAYVASPTASAIYAFNEAESGNGYALQAETISPSGIAIYGRAENDAEYSTGIGVHGRSDGDYGGTGVYGEATNTGTTYGVRGVSAHGTGVRGDHQDTGNFGSLGRSLEGVFGRSVAPVSGIGVHGQWDGSTGYGFGGAFTTTSSIAAAVLARNEATTPGGIGVLGIHASSSGEGYGLFGQTESATGYAGYFVGGRNYFEGKVGIGTINPSDTLDVMGNAKVRGNLDVDGLVDADDFKLHGTTADGWVLTSDASGIGTWQSPPSGDGVWQESGSDISYIAGNVGIGTTTPEHALEVDGKILIGEIETGSGWIRTLGINDFSNVQLTHLTDHPNNGYVSVKNYLGMTRAGMFVDASGFGTISAQVKSFRVPHPNESETDIWYACVEGPEAAMYVRGTGHLIDGRATIELPGHFRALAVEDSMTVQLTPRSFDSKGLAVGHQALNGIEVGELGGGLGDYEFHWEVKAVRRAHQDFEVSRPWTHATSGGDLSVEQRWAARLQMIEKREQRIREIESRLATENDSESN